VHCLASLKLHSLWLVADDGRRLLNLTLELLLCGKEMELLAAREPKISSKKTIARVLLDKLGTYIVVFVAI